MGGQSQETQEFYSGENDDVARLKFGQRDSSMARPSLAADCSFDDGVDCFKDGLDCESEPPLHFLEWGGCAEPGQAHTNASRADALLWFDLRITGVAAKRGGHGLDVSALPAPYSVWSPL